MLKTCTSSLGFQHVRIYGKKAINLVLPEKFLNNFFFKCCRGKMPISENIANKIRCGIIHVRRIYEENWSIVNKITVWNIAFMQKPNVEIFTICKNMYKKKICVVFVGYGDKSILITFYGICNWERISEIMWVRFVP